MPSNDFPAVTGDGSDSRDGTAHPADGATAMPSAWSGDPLLAAKFSVPAASRTFVTRRRLLDRLTDAVSGPLTLVTGPAGTGKTTLAASWVRLGETPGPVVWLTLDADDDAPGVFWAYVLEGFRRALLPLPGGVGAPACPGSVDHSLLVRLSSALESLPEPVVLVLDGFDQVPGREVATTLEFVLSHAGPHLRLVLTARVDPSLPLHRYRAEDRLAEIRATDLAFTPDEAAALLRGHDLAPADDTVNALAERTEGWAAGLRLCAMAMQRSSDPDGFVRSFAASQQAVADYLVAEVLDAQPDATRELLLRTSILDRVHPELANALTGRADAERVLARLTRANAFVEPIAETPWCRLHPLFAQVLQAHLRSRRPGLAPRLHRRAARWLADAGQVPEALAHAVAACDWHGGAAVAVRHLMIGRLLVGPEAERLQELFFRMPSDVRGVDPALVAGACCLSRRDVAGCREQLAAAEHALRRRSTRPTPEVRLAHSLLRLLCQPYAFEENAGDAHGAAEAAREVGEAMKQLPQWRIKEHPEIEVLWRHGLGCALLRSGRLDDARRAFTDAVGACTADATDRVGHEALGMLALTESIRGALITAEGHAQRSLRVADRHGIPPTRRCGAADLALAVVASERDDHRTTRRHLDLAAACPDIREDPVLATESAILRSRLHRARGESAAARAALDEHGRSRPAWSAERLAVERSAVALARGDPEAAIAALPDADGPAPAIALAFAHLAAGRADRALRLAAEAERAPEPSVSDRVRIRLLRAHAAMLGGDPAAAHDLFRKAMDAARPEQLRRPFTEAGPRPRRPIDGLGSRHGLPVARPARTAPGSDGGQDAPALVEPLSGRERDVLRCVARMMSNDEIAAELHLSVNTVKTHLRSVYRKLCVSRRREAVERGRALRLL